MYTHLHLFILGLLQQPGRQLTRLDGSWKETCSIGGTGWTKHCQTGSEGRGLQIATEGTSSGQRSDYTTREKHGTVLQAGLAQLDDLGEEVGLLLSERSHSHKLSE